MERGSRSDRFRGFADQRLVVSDMAVSDPLGELDVRGVLLRAAHHLGLALDACVVEHLLVREVRDVAVAFGLRAVAAPVDQLARSSACQLSLERRLRSALGLESNASRCAFTTVCASAPRFLDLVGEPAVHVGVVENGECRLPGVAP